MRKVVAYAVIGVLAAGSLGGCSWTPKTEKGALVGGATGAVIGGVATKSVAGAAVGGGLGAVTGYYLAKNSYRCQKVNIFGQPYWGWCLKK
jgi:YMGG-like Gly-zipper